MTDEEFDSSMGSRPFGTADATEAYARMRRCVALGVALWGGASDDLQRQLLAPYPQIPTGFVLSDFLNLEQHVQTISAASVDPRCAWLPASVLYSPAILIGTERFTIWEARCEIVRRAIEYLGGR
jgi:hypothetical protein